MELREGVPAQDPSAPGPASLSLVHVLRRRCVERPEARLYTFLGPDGGELESLTYGELDRRARALAARLEDLGGSGERALLLFPPGLEFVVGFLGCLYAGVVAVPAYPPRPRRDEARLQAILQDAAARVVLCTDGIRDRVEELARTLAPLRDAARLSVDRVPEELAGRWSGCLPEPAQPAFLQYTSGSTAEPKGVVVTHGNLAHNEEAIRRAFGQSESSIVVGWLPFYHDMGLIGNLLQPLWSGSRAVLMSPVSFLQRPLRWLEAISRYRATTSGGPDFAYDLCARRIDAGQRRELDLSSWTVAFNGAEPIRAETLDRFAEAFAPAGFRKGAFFPCYGLAEATLFVTGGSLDGSPVCRRVAREELERHRAVEAAPDDASAATVVSSGRTRAGHAVRVVDPESRELLPAGRVGEIWVSGPSVAGGYWNRPETTEELFRARTAAGGGPYLRTGDLGFLHGDELYVTGRLKDLIILRGRNHYPQDFERTAEESHPSLRPGCGAAFPVERGGQERVVLVQEVGRGRWEEGELAEMAETVRRRVADEHQVAVEEVVLVRQGSVPKTSSGKIRRRACRDAYRAGELEVLARSAAPPVEPAPAPEPAPLAGLEGRPAAERRRAVEAFLATELPSLLRVAPESLETGVPLTALGLDSLAAVELKNRVEAATGAALPLARLLEGATAEEVAAWAAEPAAEEGAAAGPGPEPSGSADGPASRGQRALWLLERMAPESGVLNLSAAARTERALEPGVLRRALARLTVRHEALRTTFVAPGGELRRRVHGRLDPELGTGGPVPAAEVPELFAREAVRPFDLGRGPLLRAVLLPLEEGGTALFLGVHHLVCDVSSAAILLRELGALYAEETGEAPADLAPPGLGYGDYVRWQEGQLAGARGEAMRELWQRELAGGPEPLRLPADRPRPAARSRSGCAAARPLGEAAAARLRAFARERGTTAHTVLLAGFHAFLHRYSGQDGPTVAVPAAGRGAPGLAGLVGYLVNPLPLRADLDGRPSFRDVVEQVGARAAAALEHQDLPAPFLDRGPGAEGWSGDGPFQAMFVLYRVRRPEDAALAAFALGEAGGAVRLGGLELAPLRLPPSRVQCDATLAVADLEDRGFLLSLQLDRDLFEPVTGRRMLEHLASLLEHALLAPGRPVDELPLLTAPEQEQVLGEWQGRPLEGPPELLHASFRSRAAERPDAVALVTGLARWSYGDLARRVEGLAARLAAAGLGPDDRAAVLLERGPHLVVSLLAVLRTGAAYVPVDPAYPRERRDWIVQDAGARLLVTEEGLREGVGAVRCPVVLVRADGAPGEAPEPGVPAAPEPRADPRSLAYVIYTSGSTGRPKGVAIEHRSASALVAWARRRLGPGAFDGMLASTSVCFDLSVFELFGPLATGGTVVLARDALALPRLPAANEVRTVNTVPSAAAELVRSSGIPPSVSTVLLAGEPLRRNLVDALYALGPVRDVANLYGPSEDTTYSTFVRVPPGDAAAPTIGRPVDGTRLYVTGPALQPIPPGVPGELVLAGAGLARGYLGRPVLTAARFVPDPLGREPGGRLYRTGDLARHRRDGEVEFLGRLDHQVKVRGFRIELGEVEAALAGQPAVREAVVVAAGHDADPGREGAGERRLVAYLVPRPGSRVDAGSVREQLLRKLPEPMVPSVFVVLEELPRTPNGKIDRTRLPSPVAGAGPAAGTLPRTRAEELVAEVWREVFGLDRVGVEDGFLALGGHSLLAARIEARLRERAGIELPLRAFFESPTVELLARRIAPNLEGAGAPGAVSRPWARSPAERAEAPLSPAQERLWMLHRLEPGSAAYHVAGAAELTGGLDLPNLHRSLRALVARQEVLRTRYPEVDGTPRAVVDAVPGHLLGLVDLAGLPREAREAEATAWERREARRPFDLAAGPVLRLHLLRLGPDRHRLGVTLHHVAADEASLDLFVGELARCYGAAARSGAPAAGALPLCHADVAAWQRERLAGGELEPLFAWWSEHLRGVEPLDVPADRPRPPVRSDRGGVVRRRLAPALAARMDALAREAGASSFMAWLAVFQAALHRYCGDRALPVGTPVSIRDDVRLEGIFGFLVNTLVLRLDGFGEPSFREVLGRARTEVLATQERAALPFESLVERLSPRRSLDRNPLFDVLFALHRPPRAVAAAGLRIEPESVPTGTAKLDLSLFVVERAPGELELELEYAADLFDRATALRLLGHLESLAGSAVEAPDRAVSELTLLPAAERQAVLREWCGWVDRAPRGPGTASGSPPLPERIARRVRETPHRVALVWGNDRVSYGELGRRVERLARRLREAGVGPEAPVAVLSDRSPEMVAALLATLWAGAAYVPLDPAYPAERMAYLLGDSGARVLWTSASGAAAFPRFDGTVLAPRPGRSGGGEGSSPGAPPAPVDPDALAYVIYTSGSTGTPKGVGIRHGGLAALVDWAARAVPADDLEGVLASTSICFDLSAFELFVPLALGGTVVLADDALALPDLPAASRVRLLNTVPSAIAELVAAEAVPPSVRTVNLAGEPLRRDLVDRVYAVPGVEAVWNLYGPSEDTTYSTAAAVAGPGGGKPTVGRPLPETRVHLLDPALEPVPTGVPGGLWIAGRGLARGYLGRPARTAARFRPDPFGTGAGERIYWTGDLARFRADGELEFLGRMDTQVKVRGHRIELGEVEVVLERHPAVREAAVEARPVAGDLVLVAYYAAAPGASAEALSAHLARWLPPYMVPPRWVELPELPRTPNGKLDRRALPDPEPRETGAGHAPPRTPLETELRRVWTEVLGHDVGVHDDFFASGGHSLTAIRVVARLREPLGLELPLRTLFEAPTIALLARRIEEIRAGREGGATPEAPPPLTRLERGGAPPLSFSQERLWFLDRLEPGSPVYNLPAAVRLEGELDVPALRRAIRRIVARHESLRTTVAVRDGVAVQAVDPRAVVRLPVIDLSGRADGGREEAVRRLLEAEALRPFDLTVGPLLRTLLARLGGGGHVFLLTVHHIVADGWSLGVFLEELAAFYADESGGPPAQVAPLPVQYGDFAVWQRSWLSGEVLERQLGYWRERLAGAAPVLELPTDRPRPAVQSYRGGSRRLELDPETVAPLRAVAGPAGATLFMTLLAAFATLLHRYSGQADLVLGTPTANRDRLEVEPLVGLFANSLVLRLDAGGDPAFHDFLGRVRDATVEGFTHQDVPFEKLVEELRPQRNLSHNPIYQAVFALEEGVRPDLELPGLTVSLPETDSGTAKFDLALYMEERRGRLTGLLEYNRDLFDGTTASRLLGHFRALVAEAGRNPGRRLSELGLVSAAERHQVLVEENDTVRPAAAGPFFHQRFAHRAAVAPDAPAVSLGDRVLTYGEVSRRARALAAHLSELGVGPDVPVAVCMERSPELVVAMLGILHAGGAYLPLDPAYPEDRLALMLRDSGARVLLTQDHLRDRLCPGNVRVVVPERRPRSVPEDALAGGAVSGDHLAYLIYTSGSTGRPKGVMIRHASLASYLDTALAGYAVAAEDRVLQFCSISFDISLEEIVPCLSAGAELVFRSDSMVVSIAAFLEACQDRRLTVMSLPTAYWHEITARLAGGDLEVPPALRLVIIAGERALPERLAAWLRVAPERPRLVNTYGLTESTIISTLGDLTSAGIPGPGREVSIGRTIPDTELHVLDRRLAPAPLGVPGELFIGGGLLARGYRGRFRGTAERFVPDPFARRPGARAYRTGDLARRLPDGRIEFLGRGDHQVKIRGYRIELGEIEAALVQHDEVDGAVVTTVEERPGDKRLVAYVTGRNGHAPAAGPLRAFLGATLPDYMVPGLFVALDELPMTPNGKVDRDALPAPEGARLDAGAGFVAPGNDAEEAMAAIWAEVLGVERVGIHDNFFDLGGHSLLLIRLHERIKERFGSEVAVVDLFRHPTVHALARHLGSGEDGSGEVASLEEVRERAGRTRASAAVRQRRFQEARRRLHD